MINDPIAHLPRRVEEFERRVLRTVHQGTVTDVDKSTRRVRVDDGLADDGADPHKIGDTVSIKLKEKQITSRSATRSSPV